VGAALAPVKAMFADAFEDGAVRANPTGVRVRGRRAGDGGKAKAMTRAELSVLLAELPPEWRLPFELLAHTGLRISELIGLRWQDVRFGERPHLAVRWQDVQGAGLAALKSADSRRDVPLSPGMAARLWELGGDRRYGPGVRVARGVPPPGEQRAPARARPRPRARVAPVGHSAQLPPHVCVPIDHGRNVAQVAAWLGHADPAFTLRTYVHLMDEGAGDASFMDDVTGGERVRT
jgi:integrase